MKIFSSFILPFLIFSLPLSTFAQSSFGERVPVVDEEHIDVSSEILKTLQALLKKEIEQDPIQEFEAKKDLAEGAAEEVRFIKQGYRGYLGSQYLPTLNGQLQNPGTFFEKDPAAFYQSVVDSEFNKFMSEHFGYNFNNRLASPIDTGTYEGEYLESVAQILITQKENEGYSRDYTLDLYTGGPEETKAFLDGDFSKGGWNAWYNLTQNPDNNIYGVLEKAEQSILENTSSALHIEEQKLNQGGGFHATEDSSGKILTPSSVNRSKIERALSTCQRSLELSDEFTNTTKVTDQLAIMCDRLNEALNDLNRGLLGASVIDIFQDIFDLDFSRLLERFIGDIDIGGFDLGDILF